MFIAVLFIVVKNSKYLKSPSVSEWINKLWYTHTTEYYTAIKRNELLISATCKNLKIIMLSKRGQTKKEINCMIPFT